MWYADPDAAHTWAPSSRQCKRQPAARWNCTCISWWACRSCQRGRQQGDGQHGRRVGRSSCGVTGAAGDAVRDTASCVQASCPAVPGVPQQAAAQVLHQRCFSQMPGSNASDHVGIEGEGT
eukprot:362783-Chlamydomonas_euryale.AAC.2